MSTQTFLPWLGASAILGFLGVHVAYLTGRMDTTTLVSVAASCAAVVFALALSVRPYAAPTPGRLRLARGQPERHAPSRRFSL
jgi:hypothetical protein